MEKFNYNDAKDLAMRLGLVAGTMWVASFLMVVYGYRSVMGEVGYLLGMASLPVIGMRLRRIRRALEGMTMMNAWWVAWMTFMCAMLLTTAAQYVYFQWLDDGRMVEGILSLLQDEQVVKAYSEAGGQEMLSQLTSAVEQIGMLSVRDLVMSFMSSNIMIGMLSSILAALMTINVRSVKQEQA